MTTPVRQRVAVRRRRSVRRGYTLAELAASMVIMVILMGAMTSVVVVAGHAIPDSEDPAQKKVAAMDVVDQMAGELFYATSITEATQNAVTFTVADRGHGAAGFETIRYEWAGTPGDPLTREYNSGTVVNVCEEVQDFELVYSQRVEQLEGLPRVLLVGCFDNDPQQDAARQTKMEAWGFTVTHIDGGSTSNEFATAMASADVLYVSKEAENDGLGELPTNPSLGLVNELRDIYANLRFSSSNNTLSDTAMTLLDNSHFVTEGLPIGPTTIAASSIDIPLFSGTVAPGLSLLARVGSDTALAVIDLGDELLGGTASIGRRVKLPWGSGDFDFKVLTNDALTIMRRSIVWAAEPVVYTGIRIVLKPTEDAESLRTEVQIFNMPKVNAPDGGEEVEIIEVKAMKGLG